MWGGSPARMTRKETRFLDSTADAIIAQSTPFCQAPLRLIGRLRGDASLSPYVPVFPASKFWQVFYP